jgi:parvulin-like peptidyl-prolyl isomerase
MKIALRPALALLLLVGLLAAAGCGGNDDVPANAVATVDGAAITKAQLDELMARARKSYEAQQRTFPKAGTTEYQGLQSQAVAYLVQRLEFESEAKARDITVTEAEIDKGIETLTKENFGGDDKALQKALKEQGVTVAQLRSDVRADVLAQELTAEISKDVKVTDADITASYNENKAQYTVPESREVRHILVKTKGQADSLYADLQGGADFAALAKKNSQDPGSKDNGGKLTVARGQTVAPFDKVAFSIAVGKVSQPVKTEFGYHLIEALGAVKPGKVTPLSEVRTQIKAQLEETKKNESISSWLSGLQKEYEKKISYSEGYEPPTTETATTSETPAEG